MHMEDPEEKSWVQERIEGKEKEISFTPEGKKAMLNRVLKQKVLKNIYTQSMWVQKDLV